MANIDLSLFDISTIEEKHKNKKREQHSGPKEDADAHQCARPMCQEPAYYRAPKSPQQLNEYRYFCLKHIQEHNKRWNFCANMSEDEIIHHLEQDIIGHRPTWVSGLGIKSKTQKKHRFSQENTHNEFDFDDPFDLGRTIFGDQKKQHKKKNKSTKQQQQISKELQKIYDACTVLGVDFPVNYEILRKSYKKLVKQYHPDINKKDLDAEAKLRRIVAAYKLVTEYLQL